MFVSILHFSLSSGIITKKGVVTMLKYYEVENFKSFKERTIISLEKTNYKVLSETNVRNSLLKGILFVGANASGKSNSVLPIKLLLDIMFKDNNISLIENKCLFSVNPKVSLRYCFEIDNSEIRYEIDIHSNKKSIDERLHLDDELILDRCSNYAKVTFTEKKEYSDIPDDLFFLRELYFNTKFRGMPVLQKWFEFLSNSVYFDLYEKKGFLYKNQDLGLISYLDKYGTDEINEFFKKYNFDQQIEYDSKVHGKILQLQTDDKDKKAVFFKRREINEPIPFDFESLGNRNLLILLPVFFNCIRNNGILILDEFSSGFHNELEELLVKYFMKNSDRSQLLFVSHSTNLLSNRILRPDQLYSVDFSTTGSHINRFSNEQPREAQNLEKMYLSGVFKGVPIYEED